MARNQHRLKRALFKQRGSAARVVASEAPAARVETDQRPVFSDAHDPAILAAVEEQLTRYFAAMAARVDATHEAGQAARAELSIHVQQQISATRAELRAEQQRAAKHFDEQSTTLGRRVDEAGRALESQLHERALGLDLRVDEGMDVLRGEVTDQVTVLSRKVDDLDSRAVGRMLAMEERINEHAGVRRAEIEATIERVSSGINDAINALSDRLGELDNANLEMLDRFNELAFQVGKVDEEALSTLSDKMSSAVGESMLVRIELERVAASTGEHIDRANVRIGELAAQIADAHMDVSTAVQLERLEEIERALIELDPDQFLRKDALEAAPSSQPLLPPLPIAATTPPESTLSSW